FSPSKSTCPFLNGVISATVKPANISPLVAMLVPFIYCWLACCHETILRIGRAKENTYAREAIRDRRLRDWPRRRGRLHRLRLPRRQRTVATRTSRRILFGVRNQRRAAHALRRAAQRYATAQLLENAGPSRTIRVRRRVRHRRRPDDSPLAADSWRHD